MDQNGQIWFKWPLYLLLWARIPYKKWSSHHSQQKNLTYSTWLQSQKWQNDLSSFPRQVIQHHSNPSLCSYHQCQKSWSVLWRPRRPLRTNTLKKCSLHHWGLKCKNRKSRYTLNNRQIWPWRTKRSREKTNWILPRGCTSHRKYPFSTTQEMNLHIDITKWSILK